MIQRETRSWGWTLFSFSYMTVLAYLGALAAYQIGSRFLRLNPGDKPEGEAVHMNASWQDLAAISLVVLALVYLATKSGRLSTRNDRRMRGRRL